MKTKKASKQTNKKHTQIFDKKQESMPNIYIYIYIYIYIMTV